jgi:putative ABC transport system permease protein
VITVRTAALLKVALEILGKAGTGLAVVAAVSLASIKRSLQLEYFLLAVVASLFAVLLGSAIALPLLQLRLTLPSVDLIWIGALVAVSVSSLALGLGAVYLLQRLRIRPAVLLRSPS